MPRLERTGSVSWEGNVARGTGRVSTESGVVTGVPYSLASRIGQPEGKTNPEERLGPAHAS